MYMELDEDSDDDESDELEALTCVRHVTFVVKHPPYDVYKLTHVSHTVCPPSRGRHIFATNMCVAAVCVFIVNDACN